MNYHDRFRYIPIPDSLKGKLVIDNQNDITDFKNLSKVNIFIGENNSGKSFILRELLKQPVIPYYYNDDILGKINLLLSKNKSLLAFHLENLFQDNRIRKEDNYSGSIIVHNLDEEQNDDELIIRNFINDFNEINKSDDLKNILIDIIKWRNKLNNCQLTGYKSQAQTSPASPSFDLFKNNLIQFLDDFLNDMKNLEIIYIENEKVNKIYLHTYRTLTQGTIQENIDDYLNVRHYSNEKEVYIETGIKLYDFFRDQLLTDSICRDKHQKFEEFIGENFFNNKRFSITPVLNDKINSGTDNKEIRVKVGDEQDFPLYDLGTGLQMIIMLTYPLFYYETGLLLIEEPELFIHPRLQRKLIEIYSKHPNSDNFQIFISTHSNHIIDVAQFRNEVSLFTIEKEPSVNVNETKFKINKFNFGNVKPYDLIGVQYSSLALANCIIWVEGPSDRIYINKWIELYSDLKLLEGFHYQILFYGGSSLTHYEFIESKDKEEKFETLINMIKINGHAIFVADKDIEDNNEPLKERVDRVKNEIEEGGGYAWITEGREIEHYLPHDLINKLKEKDDLQKLDDSISFKKYLENNKSKMKSRKPQSKVDFAYLIREHITKESMKNHKNIEKQLSAVIHKIKLWNDLEKITSEIH